MYSTIAKFFATQGVNTITAQWKLIAIGVLLFVVVYQNISDSRWAFWVDTIPYLRSELTTVSYELDLALQENEQLTEVIEERNAEIIRWGEITQQLEQSTALLQDEISGIGIKSNERIRVVERQVIPQECTGAMHFLYDSIPELQYDDILQLGGE